MHITGLFGLLKRVGHGNCAYMLKGLDRLDVPSDTKDGHRV